MSTSNLSSSSTNEKLFFKCDQYATNISEKLLKFYEEEDFCDTVLIAGKDGIRIPGHKIVFSASSGFFLQLFRSISTNSNSKEVKLPEIHPSTLKSIVDYMYSGAIELNLENIEAFLQTAVSFKMEDLVDGCCDFVEKYLNSTNCLKWLFIAKDLNLCGLQEKSSKFIYTYFKEVTQQSSFFLLDKTELKYLLFNDNPHADLEEQLFLSLVNWIEYKKEEREHLVLELLSLVRYQFLTPKFIIENSKSVRTTFRNCEFIFSWLKYHLSPESRTIEQQNFNFTPEPVPKKELQLRKEKKQKSFIGFISLNDQKELEMRRYNTQQMTWSMKKRSRPLLTKKSVDSMIVIDEKLFVVGGLTGNVTATNSVECIDLQTFELTDLPPMRIARCQSQLAIINQRFLCVYGGFENVRCDSFITSMEIFNFSTHKWSDLQPLFKPDKRSKIVHHNGILYIFDFHYGCVQCYDVISNQWTSKEHLEPLDDSVIDFQIAANENFVYLVCNFSSNNIDNIVANKKAIIKRFDLSNYTWREVAMLPDQLPVKQITAIGNKILFQKCNFEIVVYNLQTKKLHTLSAPSLHNTIICHL